MGNRHEPSSAMGCLSALLALVALFVVTFFWPVTHPGALEKWFPFTVLFTVCASVVALVLAFIALLRGYPGRGYAVGGILLAVGAGLLAVGGVCALNAGGEMPPQTRCLSNLKQLALAQMMYSEEWNGRLPPASDWVGALAPYVLNTDIFTCPADRRHQRQTSGGFETSYTMNELCDGQDSAAFNVPADTALLFEGTALYGRGEVAAFRHPMARKDALNVGYVDGHCKMLDKPSFEQVRWEP